MLKLKNQDKFQLSFGGGGELCTLNTYSMS